MPLRKTLSDVRIDTLEADILKVVKNSEAQGGERMMAMVRATAAVVVERAPSIGIPIEALIESLMDLCIAHIDALLSRPRTKPL